jgi:antitoxin (DNA-binding transcriptional repressor) of toxin-antitoxin stability system
LLPRVARGKFRVVRRKSEAQGASETRISATEASRSFSRLLDEVEAGRQFRVHRRGRDLCTVAPAAVHGRRASECVEILRARSPVLLDDAFGDVLLRLLADEAPEERPEWGS